MKLLAQPTNNVGITFKADKANNFKLEIILDVPKSTSALSSCRLLRSTRSFYDDT